MSEDLRWVRLWCSVFSWLKLLSLPAGTSLVLMLLGSLATFPSSYFTVLTQDLVRNSNLFSIFLVSSVMNLLKFTGTMTHFLRTLFAKVTVRYSWWCFNGWKDGCCSIYRVRCKVTLPYTWRGTLIVIITEHRMD